MPKKINRFNAKTYEDWALLARAAEERCRHADRLYKKDVVQNGRNLANLYWANARRVKNCGNTEVHA